MSWPFTAHRAQSWALREERVSCRPCCRWCEPLALPWGGRRQCCIRGASCGSKGVRNSKKNNEDCKCSWLPCKINNWSKDHLVEVTKVRPRLTPRATEKQQDRATFLQAHGLSHRFRSQDFGLVQCKLTPQWDPFQIILFSLVLR